MYIKLVAFILTIIFIFCGCRHKQSASNKPSATAPPTPSVAVDIGETGESYSDIMVTLSKPNLRSFENHIKGIYTEYPYSEFFGIDEAYELNKVHHVKAFDHGLANAAVTGDMLFDAVTKNNKKYRNENPIQSGFLQDIPNHKLKEYCGYIVEAFHSFCTAYPAVDIDEAKCLLNNLTAFRDDSTTSLAYVLEKDNRLGISKKVAQSTRETQEEKNELRHIIYHEIAHFFQKPCLHNKKDPYMCGISKRWDSLTVNPYYWHFYFEASAEKAAADLLGEKAISYTQAIRCIESVTLAMVLNDSAEINQQVLINMTKNEDLFYRQFTAHSDSEKKEIAKMMFTTDLILFPSEHTDFFKAAGMKADVFSPEGKPAVCETLTKQFYANLAQSITNSDGVTLGDAFYLINLWEADLHYYLTFSDEKTFEQNKKFMRNYIDLQDAFWSAITTSEKIDLAEAFSRYKPGSDKNRLLWLPEDKRGFIFERYVQTNRNKPHIRQQATPVQTFTMP